MRRCAPSWPMKVTTAAALATSFASISSLAQATPEPLINDAQLEIATIQVWPSSAQITAGPGADLVMLTVLKPHPGTSQRYSRPCRTGRSISRSGNQSRGKAGRRLVCGARHNGIRIEVSSRRQISFPRSSVRCAAGDENSPIIIQGLRSEN
jgi:hypothetical protein